MKVVAEQMIQKSTLENQLIVTLGSKNADLKRTVHTLETELVAEANRKRELTQQYDVLRDNVSKKTNCIVKEQGELLEMLTNAGENLDQGI